MSLKVSRILHAGYSFECEATQILFDPIFESPFSRNCFPFPSIVFDQQQIRNLKLDAVFISHYHDDHCSMDSLNLIDRATAIYIFCIHNEMLEIIRELGFANVNSIQLNETIEIGSIRVTAYPALDVDVDSIFHIQAAGLNILNVVDSWIDNPTLVKLSQRGPWDIVLWPFQTMREIEVLSPSRFKNTAAEIPPEWIEQLKRLNPKITVPSSCQFIHESWSWYNHAFFPISYNQFENEIKHHLPNTEIVRLNPGVSLTITPPYMHLSAPLAWIKPIGNQEVDYDFKPEIAVPTTAYVASKLPAASAVESSYVYSYVTEKMIDVYVALYDEDHEYESGYFKESRLWRLDLYDHLGQVRSFKYRIQGRRMSLVKDIDSDIHWLTEVPLIKVFAAIELGESLTSMYMRINDTQFSPAIEEQLADVDLLEDPLVRCLFNGVFGAYQKAQLERLINQR